MGGVAGWAGCGGWGVPVWLRLLTAPRGGRRAPQQAELPDELTLLGRAFGPDEPSHREGEPGAGSGPSHEVVAGEEMFRFGDVVLVRGVLVYWVRCVECGVEGPQAGTADSALTWVKIHPRQRWRSHAFLLLSAAPVRVVPVAGR